MMKDRLNIVWVTRAFLDYRVPVFFELSQIEGVDLKLLYSSKSVPARVRLKAKEALGDRAQPLINAITFGREDQHYLANKNFSFDIIPGLTRKIRALRPDVIVCDGFFKWTVPAVIIRCLYKTPIVIAYEGTAHTERQAQFIRRVYRRLIVKLADAMTCNGILSREYVEALNMDRERITLGHMTADTVTLSRRVDGVSEFERDALRRQLDVRGTAFLYVGRLDQRKGTANLVRAWTRAGIDPTSATLLLVGDGPEQAEIKAILGDSRCRSVKLIGAVDYDEIHKYYRAADVFVTGTLEDNWSLVVPEAMVCGLPVATSIYNGCWPELVQSGVNGWTFDPCCERDTIDVFLDIIRQTANLREMGQRSRDIVSHHNPKTAAYAVLDACRIAASFAASGRFRKSRSPSSD